MFDGLEYFKYISHFVDLIKRLSQINNEIHFNLWMLNSSLNGF